MRLYVLLTVLLATIGAQAQPDPMASAAGTLTPSLVGSPSVFEVLRTRYHFETDGTGYKDVAARILIQHPLGAHQAGDLVFQYMPLHEKIEIAYVLILRAAGGTERITNNSVAEPPTSEQKLDVYDEVRVRLPHLSPGDRVEYEVRTIIVSPLVPNNFYIQYSFHSRQVIHDELIIEIPATRKVQIRVASGVEQSVAPKAEMVVYSWHPSAVFRGEEAASFAAYLFDVQLTSFTNWDEVGRWYAGLVRPYGVPSRMLQQKAAELLKGSATDIDKVRTLYAFTATKIKYLNLMSLGVGGYRPRSPEETVSSGYGDCKDKATLLTSLLTVAGIKASPVLIDASRNPNKELPSPSSFTHVIVLARLGSDEIWMDPSPATLPFQMLPYSYRSKEALLVDVDGLSRLVRTPADAPFPSSTLENVVGEITHDGSMSVQVSVVTRGDAETLLRDTFYGTSESSWESIIRFLVKGLTEEDDLTAINVSDPESTKEPFSFSFHVDRRKFVSSSATTQLALPLSDLPLPSAAAEDSTGYYQPGIKPFRLGPPTDYRYQLKLQFPPGSKVTTANTTEFKQNYAQYRAHYSYSAGLLVASRQLTTYRDKMSARLGKQYTAFRGSIVADDTCTVKLQTSR